MPQGKAIDLRERELVVRLKEHFDEEKFRGPIVSTMDPAGRVAEALGLSKCAVKKNCERLSSDRRSRVCQTGIQRQTTLSHPVCVGNRDSTRDSSAQPRGKPRQFRDPFKLAR